MVTFGLLLGCVGTDLVTGGIRFTFGVQTFTDGVGMIPVCMGLFGISEVLLLTEQGYDSKQNIYKTKTRELLPTKNDIKQSTKPIVRSALLGGFLGTLPGGGPTPSAFIAYVMEKRLSKNPEKFGTGEIAGVAGPETANNAACGAAFIPLLTLGLPTTVVMAVLLGGFMIQGVTPGPLLIEKHPDLFWGVVGSMYLGNVMLVILNLPLIAIWVRVLTIPFSILAPLIYLVCLIGAYSLQNNTVEVLVMIAFGVIGYLMKKFEYPLAPLIMAFILGPQFEAYLYQSLILGDGDFQIFFSRPISATLIITAVFLVIFPPVLAYLRGKTYKRLEVDED
jgi:putative tricarboxylic transport membrane protein